MEMDNDDKRAVFYLVSLLILLHILFIGVSVAVGNPGPLIVPIIIDLLLLVILTLRFIGHKFFP